MFVNVKENGKVKHRALYNVKRINKDGHKEISGMYIEESEGANFWLQVLTDLQNRGLEDILIACTDNLKGFSEAILSIYSRTEVQLCIVHQIRNSFKYISTNDRKVFTSDLRNVYQSVSKESAKDNLFLSEEKWSDKYPAVIRSWKNKWEELSQYFKYSQPIRKLIYTTNPI